MTETTAPLVRLFLAARPIRIAAAIIATATALLIITIGGLQSLRLSGDQVADQTIGVADAVVNVSGADRLGEPVPTAVDESFVLAFEKRNLDVVGQGWFIPQQPVDGVDGSDVNLEEENWSRNPYPARLMVHDGRWPRQIGEIAVSPSLAADHPIGSRMQFFNGRLSLAVVGVVQDDFARRYDRAYLAPGTWADLQRRTGTDAASLEVFAARNYFLDGMTDDLGLGADLQALVPPDNAYVLVSSRSETKAASPGDFAEQRVLALLAPFAASLIGALVALRFIRRIRAVLWTIGVGFRQTRSAASATLLVLVTVGLSAGTLSGLVLLLGGRLLLGPLAAQQLGPIRDLLSLAVGIVVASAAGAAVATLIAGRSLVSIAALARWRSLGFAALLGLLASVGFGTAAGRPTPDRLILATLAFGAIAVIALPALIPFLPRDPDRMVARLAIRRLVAERGARVIVASVGLLLLIAFGAMTLINGSVVRNNATVVATVPPGQIRLDLPDASQAARSQADRAFANALGLPDPLHIALVRATTSFSDGAVVAVETARDAELFLGVDLSVEQADLLSGGGVLRTHPGSAASIRFLAEEGSPDVERPAVPVEGLDDAFRASGGVMLAASARDAGLRLTSPIAVWTQVPADRRSRAQQAALAADINPDAVTVYKQPDAFSIPLSALAIALGAVISAAGVLMLLAAADARAMRPMVAGLRSIGIPSSWVRQVVMLRALATVAGTIIVALIGALLGVVATDLVSSYIAPLAPPWTLLGASIAALMGLGTLGAAFASRSISLDERAI